MNPRHPLSFSATRVLQAVAAGARYGFDIIDVTALPSGTVYPALSRLEEAALVSSRWEDHRIAQREKRPPRRYYEISALGERVLADTLDQYRALERAGRLRRRAGRPARARA